MQAIAFLLVATGNYLDTGNRSSLMFQVLVQLPSIGASSQCPGQGLPPLLCRSRGWLSLSCATMLLQARRIL